MRDHTARVTDIGVVPSRICKSSRKLSEKRINFYSEVTFSGQQ